MSDLRKTYPLDVEPPMSWTHVVREVPTVTVEQREEALEKTIFEDLVDYLKTINSDLADVVTLGFRGFDKKDVVKQLPVKSSQAYDLYAKAEKLTREFLFK